MDIGFLLCSPEISGGTNVIYEYATGLKRRGHSVTIITQQPVQKEQISWHPTAAELLWDDFNEASKRSFDVVIATWWESPYFLHLFQANHYIYFVQSIETRFFQPDDPAHLDLRNHSIGAERCRNGYFFNLPVITEAKWIQKYLEDNFNQRPFLVPNGIKKPMYTDVVPVESPPAGKLRVLVEGPVDVFHKNVPRTIELCREAGVDEVWLLTSSDIEEYAGVDRIFSRVPIAETPSIYSSCHVLVKLSYVEGMFGPPLEMFHCGGTALVYDVTGHDEYIVHNKNGIVVSRDDEESVVNALKTMRKDISFREQLCEGALQTASGWPGWPESVKQFDETLKLICEQPGAQAPYLENISKTFMEYQKLQMSAKEYEVFAQREGEDKYQKDNFLQLYVYQGDQLTSSHWKHFESDRRDKVSIQFNGVSGAFQLRVDPGIRIGIVKLFSIKITTKNGDVLAQYLPREGFEQLFVTGTSQWLQRYDTHWVIQSYGDDPQIILPELDCEIAETLMLEVDLIESGYAEYIQTLDQTDKNIERQSILKAGSAILTRFLSKTIGR